MTPHPDIERYRDDERARAEERITPQLAQFAPQPRHTRLLAHGPAAAVLLKHARQMHADLIVIGKHGGPALEERLLGSVTRNVPYRSAFGTC